MELFLAVRRSPAGSVEQNLPKLISSNSKISKHKKSSALHNSFALNEIFSRFSRNNSAASGFPGKRRIQSQVVERCPNYRGLCNFESVSCVRWAQKSPAMCKR